VKLMVIFCRTLSVLFGFIFGHISTHYRYFLGYQEKYLYHIF
jgi:hypothetical protein